MESHASHIGGRQALRAYYSITYISFGVFLPYLPQWLEARGIVGVEFGIILALRPVLAVFSPVLFGMVADRFGLRGVLIRAACILAGMAMAGLALLPVAGIPLSFGVVFAGMAMFAFFRAPMISIADVTTLEGSKSRYGTIRLFGSVGFLLSALMAGYLLDPTHAGVFPAIIAAAMFTAAGISLALPRRVVKPPKHDAGAVRRLLTDTSFRIFLFTTFLWLASHAAYDICLSLHLRDLGAGGDVIGWAWALATIAEVLLMAFSGSIFRRFSAAGLISASMGTMALRWGVLAFVSDYHLLLMLQPLHALTFGLFWIAALEYVRQRAPEGLLATAQGLYSSTAALGGGLAMLAWGPLYGVTGGVGVFSAAGAVAVVALGVSLLLKREPRAERSALEFNT